MGLTRPDRSRTDLRRELLDDAELDRIHGQAMRILENIGTEVHSDAMLDRLRAANQRVDGTRVRWDSGFVMEQLAHAPKSIRLRGRDVKHTVTIGGGSLVHTPVGGPPFALTGSVAGARAPSRDHIELVKIAHARNALPMLQSGTTEAQDLDYNSRHLEMDYSILRWRDGRSSSTARAAPRRATAWPSRRSRRR